ncbi:dapper homolog 3-like [Cavia porcellus]|uniref:dapper homolog 3-like n=1 Tax=Cavia porcellus TaxID=10141 RepID=UPI002FDF2961
MEPRAAATAAHCPQRASGGAGPSRRAGLRNCGAAAPDPKAAEKRPGAGAALTLAFVSQPTPAAAAHGPGTTAPASPTPAAVLPGALAASWPRPPPVGVATGSARAQSRGSRGAAPPRLLRTTRGWAARPRARGLAGEREDGGPRDLVTYLTAFHYHKDRINLSPARGREPPPRAGSGRTVCAQRHCDRRHRLERPLGWVARVKLRSPDAGRSAGRGLQHRGPSPGTSGRPSSPWAAARRPQVLRVRSSSL